jgi:putative SOS response-associated peptidase YedK
VVVAGLWDRWDGGDAVEGVAVLTVPANDLVSRVQNRMPVIVPRASYDEWHNPETS